MSSDKYAVIDAARAFLRAVRAADDKALHDARQVFAREANDSSDAERIEPRAHVAEAMEAENRRRFHTHQRRVTALRQSYTVDDGGEEIES